MRNDDRPFYYYVNARYAGKTAILVGPFFAYEDAGECVEIAKQLFLHSNDSLSDKASYGVLQVRKFQGHGVFNDALRQNGKLVPKFDN